MSGAGARIPAALPFAAFGAFAGLGWGAALRGLMAGLIGSRSTFDWLATFAGILLPCVVAGTLLGVAEYLRRTGGRAGWRGLGLTPIPVFAAAFPVVLTTRDGVDQFLRSGIGSGGLVIGAMLVVGGLALGSAIPVPVRAVCGIVALGILVAWPFTAPVFDSRLTLDTPRGAWATISLWTLLPLAWAAAAIPFRRLPR